VTPKEPFRDLVRQRAAALDQYADWAAAHPTLLAPADAVEAIGALLDMMPLADRLRPVDTTGVARLHAALKLLAQ
jgi:hypothetical protein